MHNTFSEHWLFQDLSSEARSALYQLGEVLEISTDQVVIEANTPNHEMYLLLEGAFRVNLPDRPGRVGGFTLGHRGPGDLVGDYSFFDAFK
ncbi:MAG: cyclic nucleotide-binding domain-containing protein, partial [Sedimenticolaceae bacterium]